MELGTGGTVTDAVRNRGLLEPRMEILGLPGRQKCQRQTWMARAPGLALSEDAWHRHLAVITYTEVSP